MKFVMSYSCGKDSTLALHKMIEAGHEPLALVVMLNEQMNRSWFHGADRALLAEISDCLGIPLLVCPSDGERYHRALEDALAEARTMGAEACAFGDIDVEDNAAWCRARCEAAGILPVFPLWHRDREENTREAVSLGYKCMIKCVKNGVLPVSLLGEYLSEETLSVMRGAGVDVCGENGEYHTVVLDGPVFRRPARAAAGEILDFGTISVIDVFLDGKA